jgi:hypothetical protein
LKYLLVVIHAVAVTLPVGQQQLQFPYVRFVDDLAEAQASFPLPGFFGQNVARMGFSENEFSGSRGFESLGSRAIGFDLRHLDILLPFFVHEKREKSPCFFTPCINNRWREPSDSMCTRHQK